MKNIITILSITIMLSTMPFTMAQAQTKSKGAVLRHVVLFSFKAGTSPDDVKKVADAFQALAGKIKVIKDLEWGTNTSPENLNQGLTHCFLLTFASDKDRDAYLVHPEHEAFVGIAKQHFDKVTVVDYWTNK